MALYRELRKYGPLLSIFGIAVMIIFELQIRAKENMNVNGRKQDDPLLITFIIENAILAPSSKMYNLTKSDRDDPSQNLQAMVICEFFKYKRGGKFIEAGAFDGQRKSNTLLLERKFQWSGLLAEPDPAAFQKLVSRNRKAYTINGCFSPEPVAKTVRFNFYPDSENNRIDNTSAFKQKEIGFTNVTCYPLYSLMLAMNLTSLDVLFIDVEGVEAKVLKTLPWDKIDIEAIVVERISAPEGEVYIKEYMEKKNYKLEKKFHDDFFFSKKKPVKKQK